MIFLAILGVWILAGCGLAWLAKLEERQEQRQQKGVQER